MARDEGEDRGIEQRLNDVALAARQLVQPVVGLHFLEEQFDLRNRSPLPHGGLLKT